MKLPLINCLFKVCKCLAKVFLGKVRLPLTQTAQVEKFRPVPLPEGQTSVRFDLTVIDDPLLDGSPKISVTASASGYSSAMELIQIIDNEATALVVTLLETATEGDVMLQGMILVSQAVDKRVSISLISDDTSEITSPSPRVRHPQSLT